MTGERYAVYVVLATGERPVRHSAWIEKDHAVSEAEDIARSWWPNGAVSVWVQDRLSGDVVWAAGLKARELRELA
jgi:hypothetical protein